MSLNLNNLPRSIWMVRADDQDIPVPEGFPLVVILDQSELPLTVRFERIADWREVIQAIKQLRVRGAPAIGIAGAAALALRAAEFAFVQEDSRRSDEVDFDRVFVLDEGAIDWDFYRVGMQQSAKIIIDARPTAVNLSWAVEAGMAVVDAGIAAMMPPGKIADALFDFVEQMIADDERINRLIGAHGADLLPDHACILTHCNAGSLATAFYGTALGVVYAAAADRGIARVYADETRPVCQGSRLTVWELAQVGIPTTLICDDMAASVLSSGVVDAVLVGADRIATNGDVANKIGTLGLAVLAKQFGVPFYVAAPTSTLDARTSSGEEIKIEQRDTLEVLPVPIEGVDVYNPAFDVTPSVYIDAIITEVGVYRPHDILACLDKATQVSQ